MGKNDKPEYETGAKRGGDDGIRWKTKLENVGKDDSRDIWSSCKCKSIREMDKKKTIWGR